MIWAIVVCNAIAGSICAMLWVVFMRDRIDSVIRWLFCAWIIGVMVAANTMMVTLDKCIQLTS